MYSWSWRYPEPFNIGVFYEFHWQMFFGYPEKEKKDVVFLGESIEPSDLFIAQPLSQVIYDFAQYQLSRLYATLDPSIYQFASSLMHHAVDQISDMEFEKGVPYEATHVGKLNEEGYFLLLKLSIIRLTDLASFVNNETEQ